MSLPWLVSQPENKCPDSYDSNLVFHFLIIFNTKACVSKCYNLFWHIKKWHVYSASYSTDDSFTHSFPYSHQIPVVIDLGVSQSQHFSSRIWTPCSLNFLHISLWMQALEAERPFMLACSVIRRYIVSSLSSTTWQWQELLTQATPDPLVPLGCNL